MTIAPDAAVDTRLRLADVSHIFSGSGESRAALDGVSLAVARGSALAVVGPSGCGKTTLLRVIAGLLMPTAGSVTIGGRGVVDAVRARDIGMVFQDAALLPWRSVAHNVRLPLELGGRRGAAPESVDEVLRLVGLADVAHRYPHQLSGGMRQRVALARALVAAPSLVLMDEPFSALDELTRAEMQREFVRIHERLGLTAVLVTHSVSEAVLLADQIGVMAGPPGRIVSVIDNRLPRPRTTEMEDSPEFLSVVREVRAALRGEVR